MICLRFDADPSPARAIFEYRFAPMTPPQPSASDHPTRRSVLKKGLLGGALLALGGGGLLAARGTRTVPLPKEGLKILDEVEYAVFHALAKRVVRPGPGAPTIDQVNATMNVDRILAGADSGVQAEVKQLAKLFENALAGLLFGGRTRPFTQLSGDEQDAVLAEWRDSRLVVRRTGYQALRVLVLAGYYSSDMIWPAVNYPGPPQGFHQPDAPVWKGGGQPRPEGNGVFHEELAPPPEGGGE